MATKPTIAIIGSTGTMGSAIAKSLAKRGHRLLLFSRSEEHADTLSKDMLALHPASDSRRHELSGGCELGSGYYHPSHSLRC